MSIQSRPTPTSYDQEPLDLLQALLDTPPAHSESRLKPVALRSRAEQRNHALSGYLLRTWVDRLLHHAEWLLMIAALGLFGFWLADGPVRDWLHYRTQANIAPVAAAAPAVAVAATALPHPTPGRADQAPLPYTTVDMQSTPLESDFIAPRRGLPDVQLAVSPQPTRLLIPAIALDTPVKEVFIIDGAWEVADYAAGYLHSTGLPGEPGNTVLAGHAGLRGAVFRDLGALHAGDDIYIDAAGWRFQYRVRESKSVWPTQVEVLAPAATPVLTLLTCTNWDTQRLVVVADLVASKPSPGS